MLLLAAGQEDSAPASLARSMAFVAPYSGSSGLGAGGESASSALGRGRAGAGEWAVVFLIDNSLSMAQVERGQVCWLKLETPHWRDWTSSDWGASGGRLFGAGRGS